MAVMLVKLCFFHFIIREPNPAVSVMYHPKSGREDEAFTWIYSRRELPERIHSHVYIVWLCCQDLFEFIMGHNCFLLSRVQKLFY